MASRFGASSLPLLLLALASCGDGAKQPQVIDSNPDPLAREIANRAPVVLPPAIKAERSMRCKDGSVLHATFFAGDKEAQVRSGDDGPSARLTAPAAGEPLVGDGGWRMTGTPSLVTVTIPGRKQQTCRS